MPAEDFNQLFKAPCFVFHQLQALFTYLLYVVNEMLNIINADAGLTITGFDLEKRNLGYCTLEALRHSRKRLSWIL
jgi:hypothetical protein